MFCLVDWENVGKWVALGRSRFTHSENKVGKLVKTSGIFFVGRYQVMEVIYSSRNFSGVCSCQVYFNITFFRALQGKNKIPVDWNLAVQCWLVSRTNPVQRAKIYFHSLFVCVLNSSPVQHLMPGIALAFSGELELPQHHRWPRLPKSSHFQHGCPDMHWNTLLGCWAWLVGRRRRHHSEACMDYLHLPAAAPSSLKGENTIACFIEGFTLQKYTETPT